MKAQLNKKTDAPPPLIALAGNPNVGKSTLFNYMTKLKQHTGNWTGKTVEGSYGYYNHSDVRYKLMDLPGTYSLLSNSPEEEIAVNFLAFNKPNAIVVICDATCIERSLNLVMQVCEISPNVVLGVNLTDEAKKKNIKIDYTALSQLLGIQVVPMVARSGLGVYVTKENIRKLVDGETENNITPVRYTAEIEKAIELFLPSISEINTSHLPDRWIALKLIEGDLSLSKKIYEALKLPEFYFDNSLNEIKAKANLTGNIKDEIICSIMLNAEFIAGEVLSSETSCHKFDRYLDNITMGKRTAIPLMLLLLVSVLWITVSGANYPSAMLTALLFDLGDFLRISMLGLGFPLGVVSFLIDGCYTILAWVVGVMLPPMAIFFPLFTLLEDLGYLPRVAFNLDSSLSRCGACGKQALTMCMGLGCNSVGVIGTRIISSPKERLIAILTNNFMPCNGRFPTIIAISTIFFGALLPTSGSLFSALALTIVIVFGVMLTLLTSRFLSSTLLKGEASSFVMELPPYRAPKILPVIITSITNRTLFVLGRAVLMALPAGAVIHILANNYIDNTSLISISANFLEPVGKVMGLDGVILLAFILGFPANEIVLPIAMMIYLSVGIPVESESLSELHSLLLLNGWSMKTAVCTLVFSLCHWPCSTTVLTIKKETSSIKWTAISVLLPTVVGISLCIIINGVFSFFSLL